MLSAIALSRGDALIEKDGISAAIESTRDFVSSTYKPVARIAARNGSLSEAMAAVRSNAI